MKKKIIAAFMLVVMLMSTIGSAAFAEEVTEAPDLAVAFQETEKGTEIILNAKEAVFEEVEYVVEIKSEENQKTTCSVSKELDDFADKNDGIVRAGFQYDTGRAVIGGVFAEQVTYTGEIGTVVVEGSLTEGALVNVYKDGAWIGQYRYTTNILGDVDGNGEIEAADALFALKAVVKLVTLAEDQIACADVDGNESIEAADALFILQKVVKLIEIFPVEAQ